MPDRIKEEFARSAGARELIERLPNLGTKQGAFKFLQQATQYDDVLFSNEMSEFVQAMSDKNLITPDQRKEYASFKANRAVQLASDPEKRKYFVDREFRPDLTPDQIEKYRIDKQAQLAQEAAVDRSNTKRYLGALGYTPEDVYRFGPDTSGYLNENIPLVGGAELPIMSRSFTPAEGLNQLNQALPIAGGVISGAFQPLGAFQDRLSGNDSGNVFNPSDSPLVAAGEAAGSEYADRIASMPGTLIGGDIGAMAGGALGARAVKGKYRGIGILLGTVLGAAGGGTVGTNINQQINENAMGHLIGAAAMAKRREAKEFNAANYSQAARIGSLAGDMTFFAPSLKVPGVGVRKAVGALSRRGTKALKNEGVRETVHDIADRATEFAQGVFESYQQSEEQKRQGLPGLTPWQILGDGAVGALLSGETKLGRAMTEPYNRLKSPEFMISNLNKLANKRAEVKADRAVRRETQLREQEGTITPTESRYRRFNLGGRLSGDVNADGQPIIKGAEYAIYDPEKRRAFIYTDNDFVLEGYRSKNAADSLTSTEFIFKRTPLIEYTDKAAGVRRSILGISRDAGVVVKDIGPDGQARISTVPIADIRNEKIATRIQNVMTEHGVKPNDKPAPFMPEAYENFNKQVFDAEVTLDPSLPAFPARVVKQVNQKRQGMYIVALPDGTHMRVHESQININEPGVVVPRGQVQESELPRSLSDLIPPEKILKNQWKFGQGSEDEAVLELTPEQLTTIGKIRRKYSGDLEAIKGIRDKNQRAAAIQLNLARIAKEAESVLTFEGPAPQYKRGDVIDVNTSQFGEQTAIVIGQNKYGHIVRLVDHPRIGAFTVQPSSIKGELSRSEAESVLGGTPSATQGEYTNPDFDDEFETEAVDPTGVKEETVGAPKLERDHEKVDELELTPYTKGKLAQQLSDFLENSDIINDIRDGDFAEGEVAPEIVDEGKDTGPIALLGEKPKDVTDTSTETGTDTGTETGTDTGTDTGTETGTDTGADNQPNIDAAITEITDELARKFRSDKDNNVHDLDNFNLVAFNSIDIKSAKPAYEKAFGYKDGKFTGNVPSYQEHVNYKSQVIKAVLQFYKSIGLGQGQASYAAHLMHEKILPHKPQDENSLTGRSLNSISWSGFNTAFLRVHDGDSSSFTRKKLNEAIEDYVKNSREPSLTVDQVTPYFQDSFNKAVDILKSVYPDIKFGNAYTGSDTDTDTGTGEPSDSADHVIGLVREALADYRPSGKNPSDELEIKVLNKLLASENTIKNSFIKQFGELDKRRDESSKQSIYAFGSHIAKVGREVTSLLKSSGLSPRESLYLFNKIRNRFYPTFAYDAFRGAYNDSYSHFNTFRFYELGFSAGINMALKGQTSRNDARERVEGAVNTAQLTRDVTKEQAALLGEVYKDAMDSGASLASQVAPEVGDVSGLQVVFMAKRPSFAGRAANRTKDGFIVTVKNTVLNVKINRDATGDVRVRMEMTQYDPGKKNVVGQAVTEYTAKRQSGGEWHVFNTVYGDQRDASAFFTVKGSDRNFMRNLVRGMVNHSIGMKNSDPNWKSATDIAVEQSPEAQRKASDIAARKAQAEAKRAEAEANKEKQRQANKEKWQAELALREKLAQQAAELKREELRVKQKTAETSAEVTDLKDKLEKLQAEIGASARQASDDLKAVKDQLADVTDRLRKAKKKAKDAKNDAEKSQAEAIEKALEAQAKKHKDDMTALQRIVDGVQNADKLAASQLEKKIEQLINQIIEQQKELAGRSVQLSTDTTDNDARIAALLAQMKMIESQYDAKIEELNNQIAELNKQLSGVGASVEKPKRVKKETVYKESEIDSIVQNREIITVLKEINGTQYKLDATIVNNRTQLKTVLHEQYGYTKTGAHYWSGVVDHFARAWAARQLAARQRTLDYRNAQRTTSEGEIENIMHRVLRRDEETVKSLAMLMREFYRDRFAAFAYVPELSKLDDIGYGATFTAAREDGTSFNVITAFASRDEETGVHEIAHALLRGMDPKYRKKILGQMQSLRMSGGDFSEAMPVDAEELFVAMFISSLRNKVVPVVQGKFPSGDARVESRDLELFWNGTGKYLNEILATVTEKNIKDQTGNTLTQWVAPFDPTTRLFKGMQVYINRDGGPNDELAVVVKSDPKDKATYDKYRQSYAPEGKVEVHIAGEKDPVLIDRGQITNMGGLTQGFNPGMLETLSKYLGAWYRESDFAMWKSVKHLMEDFNDTLVPSTGTSDPFNSTTDKTSDTGTDTGSDSGTDTGADTGTGAGTSTGSGTDTGNNSDGSYFARARQIYGTFFGPTSGPVIFYGSQLHESAKKEILKLFPNAIDAGSGYDGRITDAYIHSKTGMPYHLIPFKTFSIGKNIRNDDYKNGPDRYISFPELNRNRNIYSFGRDIRDISPEALQAIYQQINSTYDETIEGMMRTFISKGTQVSRSNEGVKYGLHDYHSTLSVLEELSSFLNDQKLLTALGQPDAYHLLKYGKLDTLSKEFIYGRIFMNQGVDGLVRLANLALARPMVDSLFKYEGLQPIANLSWLFDHDKKTGPLPEFLRDAANYVLDPSTGLNDKDFVASDTFDYAPILAMHTAEKSRTKAILSKMELSSDKRSRINDSTLEAMARGLDAFYFHGDPFDPVEDPFKFAFNPALTNYQELNKYERALLTGSDVEGLNSRQAKSKIMAYLALNYMSGMAKSIPTYTTGNYDPGVYRLYTKIGTTDLIKTQMYLDAVNSELKEGIVDLFRHNNNEGSRVFKPVDIDIYDGVMVFDRVKAQQGYPTGSFRVNIRTGETMFKPSDSVIWSEYKAKAKVYNPDNVLPFKERVNNNRSMLYPRRSWVTGMMLAQLNNKQNQVRQVNVPDIALSAKMPKIKFTEAERSAKVPVNSPEVKAELKPIIESMVKSGRFDGNTAYDSRGKVSNLHNLYQNAAGLSSGAALLNYARTETKAFKQWSGNNPVVEAIATHDMRPSVTIGEVSPAVRTNIRKYMAGKSIIKFVKSLNGTLTPEDAAELEVLMDDYLRGESTLPEIREAIDAAIDDSTELQALVETVTEQIASTKFDVARVHMSDADVYADASTRPRTGRPLVTVGFAPNKTLAWLRSARGYVLSSGPSDQTGYNKYGYYLRVDNPLVVDLDGQGIDAVSVEKMMAKNPTRDGIVFLNAKHSIGGLNTTHNIIIPRSEHAQLPWTTWTDTKPSAKAYPSEFDYILRDKSQDEWMKQFEDQHISSADTSIKQVPSLFKSKAFVPNGDNLDIGGGKFDEASNYLKTVHGVDNYVHDIYNRSAAHNASVEKHFAGNPPKTVTIANVLNVIKDKKHRELVLRQAYNALSPGGKVYISVYEGNRTGIPAQTTKGWQNNSKPEFYMNEIRSVFPDAVVQNGVIVASKPPKDNIAFMGRMPDINYQPDYEGVAEPAAESVKQSETPMRMRKKRVPDTADKLTSIVDFINDVTRLTLSSDLAFMTLQAGIISLSNPAIGFRAFLMAMRGFAPNLKVEWFGGIGHRKLGREMFHDIGDTMRQHPAYDLAREAGLPLQMFEIDARFKDALEIELHNLRRINPDATIEDCRTTLMDIDELGTNDEWFIKNRLSRHLPMQGQFERFNTILHDQILLLAFDNWHKQFLAMGYVEGSEKMKRALKDGARILAVTTGDVAYSTNQQRDATAGRIAKLLFTAPRWVMSRALIDPWINSVLSGDSFSLLHDLMGHDNPIWNLYKGDQAAAALGRTMYGRLVGGQILMMILAILWQNFNPETEVETDVTRQAGRIRVGDFRIDPPAGLFDHYRLGYRLLEAALQTNPADAKKAGREGGTILEKIAQDLGREVSYKSSPMLNMAVGLFQTGKTPIGEPMFAENEAATHVYNKLILPRLIEINGGIQPWMTDVRVSNAFLERFPTAVSQFVESYYAADKYGANPEVYASLNTGLNFIGLKTEIKPVEALKERKRNVAQYSDTDTPTVRSVIEEQGLIGLFKGVR